MRARATRAARAARSTSAARAADGECDASQAARAPGLLRAQELCPPLAQVAARALSGRHHGVRTLRNCSGVQGREG